MRITRRGFMATSGAAIVHPNVALASAVILEPIDAFSVRVKRHGRPEWIVDWRQLGTNLAGGKTSETSLRIQGVLPAGIEFVLQLNFRDRSGLATVDTEWILNGHRLPRSQWATIDQMLAGASLDTPLYGRSLVNFMGALSGHTFAIPRKAQLRIYHHLGVTLWAPLGLETTLNPILHVTGLILAPRPDVEFPGWRASVWGKSQPNIIPLGTHRGIRVSADVGQSNFSLVAGPLPLRFDGPLRLHINTPELAEPPIQIASLAFGEINQTFRVRIAVQNKPWVFDSRQGTFVISGIAVGTDPAEYPVIIESRAGKLQHFEMPILLQHLAVKVANTDLGRLDLGNAPFHFSIADVPWGGTDRPGRPGEGTRERLLLGANTSTMLDLSNTATLWLARARDLLDLKFTFLDAWLDTRDGVPIIRLSPETANDQGSILRVEFPPQHVMERSFLRQTEEYPDAGRAISFSEREVLRGGGADAKTLRLSIFNEKIKAVSDNDVLTAFKTFNDQFTNAYTPEVPNISEAPWIGPDGLVTMTGHRTARKTAAAIRTNAQRDVLSKLKLQQDDATIAAAIAAVPLPYVPTDPAVLEQSIPGPEKIKSIFDYLSSVNLDFKNVLSVLPKNSPLPFWKASSGGISWPLSNDEFGSLPQSSPPASISSSVMATFVIAVLNFVIESESQDGSDENLIFPTQARLSGCSYLAFTLPPNAEERCLPLDADQLTDWREFDLRVTRRASRLMKTDTTTKKNRQVVDYDIGHILKYQGILPGQNSGAQRLQDIIASLGQGPSKWDTQIELPARLILSPAHDARWRTPRALPSALRDWRPAPNSPYPVWQASFVDALPSRPSLRAIWSPDFCPDVFSPIQQKLPPKSGPIPFRTALDAADRHELIALSSVYGLPVVGLWTGTAASGGPPTSEESSETGPPAGWEISDAVGNAQGSTAQALYIPKALKTRRLSLSPLGAMLDMDTRFNPPASVVIKSAFQPQGAPLYESMSIGRWRSWVVDGFDVTTIIVRRGFLLPFGHQAGLVKVTEPRIRYISQGKNGETSGYVVEQATRLYVEVTQPMQSFPTIGQAFGGRQCPAKMIELRTLRTPDLLDPTQDLTSKPKVSELYATSRGTIVGQVPDGRIKPKPNEPPPVRSLAGMTFWPRTQFGMTGSVRFSMVVNGSNTPVSMPLLFIDDVAAFDPETMTAVAEYYTDVTSDLNNKPADYNIMNHDGTAQPYAEEKESGDCTLLTDWQTWAVGPGIVGQPYVYDPSLQAIGRLPAYPYMTQAQVRSRQLQILTGMTQPSFSVQYTPLYLQQGFLPEVNSNETFLDVVGRAPIFAMGSNGDRGGGVGQQAMTVRRWSRKLGPQGETPKQSRDVARANADLAPVANAFDGTVLPPPPNPQDLLRTMFNKDAKLLGLFQLYDIIDLILNQAGIDPAQALPVTQELTQFGALANEITTQLREDLHELRSAFPDIRPDQLITVLPEIARPLDMAEAALATANPSQLWSACQGLVRGLDQIGTTSIVSVSEVVRQFLGGLLASTILLPKRPPLNLHDIAGALVVVPVLSNAPFVVSNAIDAALSNSTVWFATDPVEEFRDEVWTTIQVPSTWHQLTPELQQDLNDWYGNYIRPSLSFTLASVTGLLGKLTENQIKFQDLSIEMFGPTLSGAVEAISQLTRLASGASTICTSAANGMVHLLQTILPDLGVCPESVIALSEKSGSIACDTIQREYLSLGKIVQRVASDAGGDVGSLQIAHSLGLWYDKLGPFAESFAGQLRDVDQAREKFLGAVKVAAQCDVDPAVNLSGTTARLSAVRDHFLKTCLSLLTIESFPTAAIPTQMADDLGDLYASWLTLTKAAAAQYANATLLGVRTRMNDFAATIVAFDGKSSEKDILNAADQANDTLTALSNFSSQFATLANPAAIIGGTAVQLEQLERSVVQFERVWIQKALDQMSAVAAAELRQRLLTVLSAVLSPTYDALTTARDAAYYQAQSFDPLAADLFGPSPAGGSQGWAEYTLLVNPQLPCPGAEACSDDLSAEGKDVETSEGATRVLSLWSANPSTSAVFTIVQRMKNAMNQALRATILGLGDVDAYRDRISDALNSFVPTSFSLSSSFILPVPSTVPSTIGASINLTLPQDTASTLPNQQPALTLISIVKTTANFTKSVDVHEDVSFKGRLSPFTLHLLDFFDIKFGNGFVYERATNSPGKLSAPVTSVKFGPALEFLQDLENVLSTGDPDNGPYTRILLDRPAIEAGVIFGIPVITLGVTFTNINLYGRVILPFDAQEATLAFSLGTLDSPFMISAGIYGGSGYFGFQANGGGIQSFDASFQFGGIASIGYGPLQGTAYVTTGAYISKGGGNNSFAFGAIFSAGFSAHIACFGVSATFTLIMIKVDGGVAGSATLTFRFSVGFFSVGYSVHVKRSMGNGFQGADRTAAELFEPPLIVLADASATFPMPALVQVAEIITTSPVPERAWLRYASQFDTSFRPA